MNLVTLEEVSKQYSERLLLDRVSLRINTGDRIGLIGVNGSGKSTLLRIIAGLEPPDSGQVIVWGHTRIRYLPQEPDLTDDASVLDHLFNADSPQMQLLRDYERTVGQLQQHPDDPNLQAQLISLSAEMDRLNGWAAEAKAKAVLTKLGITAFDVPVRNLSGGGRKRVALACALLDPADLLILDEPTNHIDADTVAWLEEYLLDIPQALLLVTHDRYFLNRIANRIVELDRRQLISYPGNYTRYLELRTTRHERLAKAEADRQKRLKRELEWLRRSPMARSTKQKARKQRIAELQRLRYDSGEETVSIVLGSRRLGKKVLRARNLSKSYGDRLLFSDLDFDLAPGDRVGIIGPSGVGKSTLLDILAGKVKPDTGTVEWGETVHLGYYDQRNVGLDDDMRVIEFIEAKAPLIYTRDGERVDAARVLEWFLFPRPQQWAKISSLSGGERRRLYLLWTLIHRPNVLLLDEPTNDLDIPTLTVLEEFLDHFRGCLIIVSHDRYFLDRTVDYLISFEEGQISARYPTPYEVFRRLRQERQISPRPKASGRRRSRSRVVEQERRPQRSRGLTWKEQRELEALEAHISEMETRKGKLQDEINASGGDFARLRALAEQLQTLEANLDRALERWIMLSEMNDQTQERG
ncbi:MAG: ABC-F family ATP-binding cassette domain-containing protein [Anaerolineae bacterium]|nr:ABC-F family ATP-binding cassette domain-containing protein [Anaerolineae bacterium]